MNPTPGEPGADLGRLFDVAAMLGVTFDVEALERSCMWTLVMDHVTRGRRPRPRTLARERADDQTITRACQLMHYEVEQR